MKNESKRLTIHVDFYDKKEMLHQLATAMRSIRDGSICRNVKCDGSEISWKIEDLNLGVGTDDFKAKLYSENRGIKKIINGVQCETFMSSF